MATIGVAIPIAEPYGTELQKYRAEFGDPMASSIPTHVTLLPPTEVAGDDLALIDEHLLAVAARFPSFRIRLRGTATFRPISPVVFVPLAEGISSCEVLAGAVRRGPLAVDLSFPYHPHVTIAHDVAPESLDEAETVLKDYRATFPVVSMGLYEHDANGIWQLREELDFGTEPDDEREQLRTAEAGGATTSH
jgi:2'-5' RNA ligase